jgi:hypothetical protein
MSWWRNCSPTPGAVSIRIGGKGTSMQYSISRANVKKQKKRVIPLGTRPARIAAKAQADKLKGNRLAKS